MRVAVNAEQLLYRSPGGIGRYTAQLLTVLPALFPDLEMAPFTARHPRAEVEAALRAAGATGPAARQSLPPTVLFEAWLRLGLPPLSGTGRVDLVHAPSVAVPPSGRAPLVVTVHDAAPALFPDGFTKRGLRFHHLGYRAAARRADAVITVSAAAAEEVARHTPIPASRLRVVPNGVEARPVDPARAEAVLGAWGLKGRPFVLWVGSLEPRKGVPTLVAAMAGLHRRGEAAGVATVLAGYRGWLNTSLLDPADLATLGSDLVQLGPVGEEDLWALYRAATLFAFPSRHEGFGLPPLEAMASATPVVASDIPALREVLGAAARLVPPSDPDRWADAICDLLRDATERERLGRAGLDRSRHFSLAAMATGTRAVYAGLGS